MPRFARAIRIVPSASYLANGNSPSIPPGSPPFCELASLTFALRFSAFRLSCPLRQSLPPIMAPDFVLLFAPPGNFPPFGRPRTPSLSSHSGGQLLSPTTLCRCSGVVFFPDSPAFFSSRIPTTPPFYCTEGLIHP